MARTMAGIKDYNEDTIFSHIPQASGKNELKFYVLTLYSSNASERKKKVEAFEIVSRTRNSYTLVCAENDSGPKISSSPAPYFLY